jgi:hypothetical protein
MQPESYFREISTSIPTVQSAIDFLFMYVQIVSSWASPKTDLTCEPPNWSRSNFLIVTTLLKSFPSRGLALSRQRLVHMYKRETSGGFCPLRCFLSVLALKCTDNDFDTRWSRGGGPMLASSKIVSRTVQWRVHTTGLVVRCPTQYRSLALKICIFQYHAVFMSQKSVFNATLCNSQRIFSWGDELRKYS